MAGLVRWIFVCQWIMLPLFIFGQDRSMAAIDSAINEGDLSKARFILNGRIKNLESRKMADSLVEYIYVSGRVFVDEQKVASGNKAVEDLLSVILTLNPHDSTIMQAYIEVANYYGTIGDNLKGYQHGIKSAESAVRARVSLSKQALIQNNLSTYSQRSGNISQAKIHSLNAIRLLESDPHPEYQVLYMAQSGMGSMMYYASRLDSAVFYFQSALNTLAKCPPTPLNKYYRVAIIQNNLSGIYNQQGESSKAINAMYEVIGSFEKYMQSDEVEPRKKSSIISFQYEAIDNLAGIFKGLGDLSRARDLLEYSYGQKKINLPENNPGIFISQILLGQLFRAIGEERQAINKTREGINNYLKSSNPDPIWLGDGYYTLALIYEARKDEGLAEYYYNLADSSYASGLGGVYDEIYLEFRRNRASFLAESGKYKTALKLSDENYNYIVSNEGKESFNAFYQLLNFSQIEYLGKNYSRSAMYATSGLKWLEEKMSKASLLVDSVKMESFKPNAIFYKARAEYELLPVKSISELKRIISDLNHALEIIDRKKSFLNNAENNRVIIAENKAIFDFVKQVELELYSLTQDPGYVDRIMNLQESFLYTRIRSRLSNDSMRFAHIPEEVRVEEARLNKLMEQSLHASNASQSIRNFKDLTARISVFREQLKNNYPDYYRLRYESFLSEEQPVEKMIPSDITLVRYFFINSSLNVLVADSRSKKIINLKAENLKPLIEQTYSQSGNIRPVADALYELYNLLWKPIENLVNHKKVVVIPDGILFSLNMEILTPQKISNYHELATKALISKHTFSYNYSIFLLKKKEEARIYSRDFIGFAPGFSESLKENYKKTINDPVRIDYLYLNMLPQPFTTSLLRRLSKVFRGKIYLEKESTRKQFVDAASDSKIIHIGTHAFSDNQYPQYSRLIFTKESSEENNLYLQDIYHFDLTSELAVLSGCETGKPGYEDGEGMISMAHAFNYAGSKSILTGLWKIDEKSSAILLEKFYKNLRKGMDKDEALKQAKLSYLNTEQNRMLYPAYWAGLVVMGDTSPVEITGSANTELLTIIALMMVLLLVGFYIYKRKKSGGDADRE